MFAQIKRAKAKSVLAELISADTTPYALRSFWMVVGSAWEYGEYTGKVRRQLSDIVGLDDADTLLSNVSNEAELLAILGPIVGLAQLERGDISRKAYLEH